MDVVGCGRCCIMLISIFGFGILQIPKGCIHIGSGHAAAAGYKPGFTSTVITTGGKITTSSHQFRR